MCRSKEEIFAFKSEIVWKHKYKINYGILYVYIYIYIFIYLYLCVFRGIYYISQLTKRSSQESGFPRQQYRVYASQVAEPCVDWSSTYTDRRV